MIFIARGRDVVEEGVSYDFRGVLAYPVISREYFF